MYEYENLLILFNSNYNTIQIVDRLYYDSIEDKREVLAMVGSLEEADIIINVIHRFNPQVVELEPKLS